MTIEEKCPYATTKSAGDESLDFCNTANKICLLEGGYKCNTYDEFLLELQAEEAAEIASLKAQHESEQEAKERYYSSELSNYPFTCASGDIERDSPDAIEPPT